MFGIFKKKENTEKKKIEVNVGLKVVRYSMDCGKYIDSISYGSYGSYTKQIYPPGIYYTLGYMQEIPDDPKNVTLKISGVFTKAEVLEEQDYVIEVEE